MQETQSDNAAELMRRIMRHPDDPNVDDLANELLRAFQSGYPVDRLREMLSSEDQRVVDSGAWIASELDSEGVPLMDDALRLLLHPSRKARFFAVNALLLWLTPANASEFASVLPLLEDADEAVRWKTLHFLSQISDEHLHEAVNYLRQSQPDSRYLPGLEWLNQDEARRVRDVTSALRSGDPLSRKYAVAAAARRAREAHDQTALSNASRVDDHDVSQFASDMLKLTRTRRTRT